MSITKLCTHLHPVHPPYPAHFNVHPAHLSLHTALCNTLHVIISKISNVIGQFHQIQTENSKLSVLPENWHSWYIAVADSESSLRTSKFQPQNSILGKFGLKSKSCSFGLKISTHDILEELILHQDLVFQNPDPEILFWANLVQKSKS